MSALEGEKWAEHKADPADAEPSPAACPMCSREMSVGDEHAGGICGNCYWKLHAEDA